MVVEDVSAQSPSKFSVSQEAYRRQKKKDNKNWKSKKKNWDTLKRHKYFVKLKYNLVWTLRFFFGNFTFLLNLESELFYYNFFFL